MSKFETEHTYKLYGTMGEVLGSACLISLEDGKHAWLAKFEASDEVVEYAAGNEVEDKGFFRFIAELPSGHQRPNRYAIAYSDRLVDYEEKEGEFRVDSVLRHYELLGSHASGQAGLAYST